MEAWASNSPQLSVIAVPGSFRWQWEKTSISKSPEILQCFDKPEIRQEVQCLMGIKDLEDHTAPLSLFVWNWGWDLWLPGPQKGSGIL